MSRWFRFYDDALNDPKIIRLSDALYRSWTGILCIASKNDGVLPCLDDVSIMLRKTVSDTKIILSTLEELLLLDRSRNGTLSPHNWRKRQYKSDVSTSRVKKFRERLRNVSETPSEQSRDRAETEQKKDDDTSAKAPLISKEAFEIAKELTILAGHDPEFVPPKWHGAPYKVQVWIANGWPREAILTSAKVQMAGRGSRSPPGTAQYFEKGIADFIAQQSEPLPEGNQNGHSSNTKVYPPSAVNGGGNQGRSANGRRETRDDAILAGMRIVAGQMARDRRDREPKVELPLIGPPSDE